MIDQLPLWAVSERWWLARSSDGAVRALRDRHYSTVRPGGRTVGPPGRRLVFRSMDGRAAWVSWWPMRPRDGREGYRCTLFRNEGAERSSELVREAVSATEVVWGAGPDWWTFVRPEAVASSVPGYCFRRAGFRSAGRTASGLVVLRRAGA